MKSKNLSKQLRAVKMVVFDVDGVLTDGGITLLPDGSEAKTFHVLDGTGIKYLLRAGLKVAILSGRNSKATSHRARELGIKYVIQGSKFKAEGLKKLLSRAGVGADEVCYAGDDLPDIPVMRAVGLAIAVPDARPEVKQAAHWVTRTRGGRGVAREICERILKAQGKWKKILSRYFPPEDEKTK